MGDIVEAPSARLNVSVFGTAPLLEVEVIRGLEVVYRHPLALSPGKPTNQYAVYWRGPLKGPCAGKINWQGCLTLDGARVIGSKPFAFRKSGDGIRKVSDRRWEITSKTSGNCNGVILEVADSTKAELAFATTPIQFRLPLCEIGSEGKLFMDKDGNSQAIVKKYSPDPAFKDVAFAFEEEPSPGMNPYWLRVVQIDGQEAWSSPIYLSVQE